MTGDGATRSLRDWLAALSAPGDLASRVVFRLLFGLLAAAESYRLVAAGIARQLWIEPTVFFPWGGLGWLAPGSGEWIYLQLYLHVLLGLAVAVGFQHRVAAGLLGLGFTRLLLACQTASLAELALLALLSFVAAAAPLGRALSADVLLRPARRLDDAPLWSLWLLRAQIGLVIVAAGLAMLESDWLHGQPLRLWLPERQGLPVLGALHGSAAFALGMSWALALLHLGLVPALLWRRTRPWAFAAWVAAQLWVHQTFDIGIVPWLLILGATLFFPPGWPRRVFEWPRRAEPAVPAATPPVVLVCAALWIAVQAGLPARALLYPGPTAWTEQGHTGSWRYLHDSKGAALDYALEDPDTGRSWQVTLDEELTAHQRRRLAVDPELIRRYARRLAQREAGSPRVRALSLATLNGREPQRLVDPSRDLAADEIAGEGWILPLEIPLEQQWFGQKAWPAPRDELDLAPR